MKYITIMFAIFWVAIIVLAIVQWRKFYDSKIIAIHRHRYELNFSDGGIITITKDHKAVDHNTSPKP